MLAKERWTVSSLYKQVPSLNPRLAWSNALTFQSTPALQASPETGTC